MEPGHFDQLTRAFSVRTGRRAFAGMLALFLASPRLIEGHTDEQRCIKIGRKCSKKLKCCSGLKCAAKKCACKLGVQCGSKCVDTSKDPSNCGHCGKVCGPGKACCRGVCRTTGSDAGNCGACGKACAADQACCNGSCLSLASDARNCGACGRTCADGQTCCSGECRDTSSDRQHCGNCGTSCSASRDCCNGVCRDLTNDQQNCGTCGNACRQDEQCCAGGCADFQSDSAHCGACGNACGNGEVCDAGNCRACDVCLSGCAFSTVQAAVDAASALSTIRVCAGTFHENLSISKEVTVIGRGSGEDGTVISGSGSGPTMAIQGAVSPAFVRLRVTGGTGDGAGVNCSNGASFRMNRCSINANAAGGGGSGGGVYHAGSSATLTKCTISGNTARYGGGITVVSGAAMTLHGCTIQDNQTPIGDGGAIYNWGTLTVDEDTVITGNTGQSYAGIFSAGQLTMNRATVTGNIAERTSGAVYCGNLAACSISNCWFSDNSHFGLENAGTLTASDCEFTGNNDAGFASEGGPAQVTGFRIHGNASGVYCDGYSRLVMSDSEVFENKGPGFRVGGEFSGERLVVRDNAGVGLINGANGTAISASSFTGNWVASNTLGGGVVNGSANSLTLTSCTVTGNIAAAGAGIFNSDGATLDLQNVTVSQNTSLTGTGGGIENWGTLKVSGGEVSKNISWWHGGGIYSSGVLTLTETVVKENQSGKSTNNGAGAGGGIYNGENGSAVLTDTLVTGNKTSMAGGGLANHYTGIVMFKGTTRIVNNTPDNCSGTFSCPS